MEFLLNGYDVHFAYGAIATGVLTEILYRTRIFKDYVKAIGYASATVFAGGLLKEGADILWLGTPDVLDIVVMSAGMSGAFLLAMVHGRRIIKNSASRISTIYNNNRI